MAAVGARRHPAQQRHAGDRRLGREAPGGGRSRRPRSPRSRRSRTTPRSARSPASSRTTPCPPARPGRLRRARRARGGARAPAPPHRRRRLPLHQEEGARPRRAVRRGASAWATARRATSAAGLEGRLAARARRRDVHLPRGAAQLRRQPRPRGWAPLTGRCAAATPSIWRRWRASSREDPMAPARERVLAALRPRRAAAPAGRPERVLHLVHGWPPWSPAGTELYAAWLARRQAAAPRGGGLRPHRRPAPRQGRGAGARSTKASASAWSSTTSRSAIRCRATRIHDRAPRRRLRAPARRGAPRLLHVHHLAGHAASSGRRGGAAGDPDRLPDPGLVAALRPRQPVRPPSAGCAAARRSASARPACR